MPTTTLTMPARPAGLAIDASGTTYVAGFGAGATGNGTEVSVFDSGSPTRNEARTLKGLHSPWDVAIHPVTGEILVSNFTEDSVRVFDPDGIVDRTLVGVPEATGLAVTATGTILAASYKMQAVYVFEGASVHASRYINTVKSPGGIAVDDQSKIVYVTFPSDGILAAFDISTGIILPGIVSGLAGPYDVALEKASGLLYVSEWAGGTGTRVRALRVGTTEFVDAAELGGVLGPWGVAVNPMNGAVYASDQFPDPGQVHTFAPVVSSVTGVNPAAGPVTGGTVVEVSGTNLGAVTSVTFNGVAGEIVGRPEPTRVVVKVPAALAAGKVAVQIAWAGNTAGKADAFTYTAVAPGKATGVSGAPGKGQVTVSWTPPAGTGGVPVASYTVTPTPAGPACATTATSCTIAGLTNGTKYRFVVRTTNTANLSTDSDASAEVTPYVPIKQTVKAKKASSKLPRKGFTTVVNWVKKPGYASRVMTATCTDGTARATGQLCRIYSYKTGKVKVRTKGYRNVQVTITLQLIPKVGAPVQYGPSATWTRTWRVR